MDYVFAPSVAGPRQDATLALHKCWGDTDAARGPGGAAPAPPPLMVMVGAMLRRPTLDAVRQLDRELVKPLVQRYADSRIVTQSDLILQLVAADDVEAIEEIHLLEVSSDVQSFWLPSFSLLLLSQVVQHAVMLARRLRCYRGLAAAIKRLVQAYGPLLRSMKHGVASLNNAVYAEDCPDALAAVLDCYSHTKDKPETKFVTVDVAELDAVLARHEATFRKASAALPVGDVRVLALQHRDDASYDQLLAHIAEHDARGTFTAAAAAVALALLGHGDVAAMLFAVSGGSPAELGRWNREARYVEFPTVALAHSYSNHVLRQPMDARLLNAFDRDGHPVVRAATPDYVGTDARHLLLLGAAKKAMAAPGSVRAPYRPRADFEHAVRGSIQYEMRLWKYAARYGFAVLDPLHDVNTAAWRQVQAEFAKPVAGGKMAAARYVATNLVGLRWLMAVDRGRLGPVDAASDLAVGRGVTVADVVAKVTAHGYKESDNYGTHEEGYVVAVEGEGVVDAEYVDAAEAMCEHDDVYRYMSPEAITKSNFSNLVSLRDVDKVNLDAIQSAAWRI